MDNNVKKCLNCGKEFSYKRSTKKFCSKKCRNAYHMYIKRMHNNSYMKGLKHTINNKPYDKSAFDETRLSYAKKEDMNDYYNKFLGCDKFYTKSENYDLNNMADKDWGKFRVLIHKEFDNLGLDYDE